MYCPRCQKPFASGQDFCPQCNVALPDKCSSCDSPIRAEDFFCSKCGTRLRESTEEQKRGTVLFADMANSTGLSLTAAEGRDLGGEVDPGQVKSVYYPVVRIM